LQLAILAYHKHGAVGDARQRVSFAQNAEPSGHLSMGIKIAGQGKVQNADLFFLPGSMAGNGIGADAYELDIVAVKLLQIGVEPRQLRGANRRPIGGIKSQYNVFLSPVVAKLESLLDVAHHCRELEIRDFV